ncbi:voltage-dependent anion-selective channel protein 2 [Caerostris darwini]|uniref:Voltage-dependent anion-selective channel protein 2 n=2 Tax=Caerostris TaxID=172845 RepID=A0AAV4PK88_9ARAC|nr:voltage-dependent anion-selective channel protein 2 [Caerostris darwini]GIX98292.1 voltage-dependent anion-selective channel protein 2 [Caerostris extrusa]
MAPPCFADLGKQSRDIFNKNYHIGFMKLECKTKTATDVNFTVSGTSNNDTGRVNAFLETKYNIKKHGITLKEKWNTDNILATEVSVEDQIAKGLKLSLDTTFAPQTGKKSGTFSSAFKNDHVHLNGDVDLDINSPQVNLAGVINYQNWLVGTKIVGCLSKYQLVKSNIGIGYTLGDFVFHSNVIDGQEFGGCLYQKVNDQLESGLNLSWVAGTNETKFGIGCVYKIDDHTSLRAKVNNNTQIGLSFTHRLRKGIQLTLSALIDGKSFNQGGHKIGLGLELEG